MQTTSTPKPFSSLAAIIFLLLVSVSTAAQWRPLEDAFQPRSEASSIVYKGKFYVFLGFGTSGLEPATSSEVYDPATNQWQLLKPLPGAVARTHQGVAQLDDQVWHIGGRLGNHPGVLASDTWIYHIGSDSWSEGPSLLDPATQKPLLWAGGGAIFIGRTLHVFGGFVNTACNGDQNAYHLTLDVDAWLADPSKPAPWKNESAPLPLKRNHFGTVVLNGKIYAIGGQTGHDCRGGQDQFWAHVFDPIANNWQRLPDLPSPRSHVEGSSFALDGKIYVLGGQQAGSVNSNLVSVFDPEANSGAGRWYNDSSLFLPSAYEGAAARVLGTTLFFSHGGEGSSRNPRNTLFSRTIERKPVYRFLFPAGCATIAVLKGSLAQGQTLLFTSDSTTTYTVTSTAAWLKPTRQAVGTVQPNGVPIGYTVDATTLAPGEYKASLVVNGGGFESATYCVVLQVGNSILEAESANRAGAVFASNNSGYTGSGYVDYKNNNGDYIEWQLNMTTAQQAELHFRYANGGTDNRPMLLKVNGVSINNALAFPATGGFNTWAYASVRVNLAIGANTIRLSANGASGPNVDHLVLQLDSDEIVVVDPPPAGGNIDRSFDIVPNPVLGSARLFLNWKPVNPVEIQVIDFSGALRMQMKYSNLNTQQLQVPMEGLLQGTYIVLVKEGTYTVRRQVLIVQ